MTPEGKVKQRVKLLLETYGVYYAMPMGTGFGNSGVPDFLACYNGRFYAIECKANGKKPTALQNKHLADIRKAGGISLVIDESNLDQLEDLLEEQRLWKQS